MDDGCSLVVIIEDVGGLDRRVKTFDFLPVQFREVVVTSVENLDWEGRVDHFAKCLDTVGCEHVIAFPNRHHNACPRAVLRLPGNVSGLGRRKPPWEELLAQLVEFFSINGRFGENCFEVCRECVDIPAHAEEVGIFEAVLHGIQGVLQLHRRVRRSLCHLRWSLLVGTMSGGRGFG